MYVKQVDLQEIFDVGSTHCTNVCRMIDAHHERYGELPNIGSRYNVVCFADCLSNYKALKNGLPVADFDYDKLAGDLPKEITTPREEEHKAQYQAGADAMKRKIFDAVWDWFNDTKVADEVEATRLMRIVRLGVLSQITGSEV